MFNIEEYFLFNYIFFKFNICLSVKLWRFEVGKFKCFTPDFWIILFFKKTQMFKNIHFFSCETWGKKQTVLCPRHCLLNKVQLGEKEKKKKVQSRVSILQQV